MHAEPLPGQARHDVAGGMQFVSSPFVMVLWKTTSNKERHPVLDTGSGNHNNRQLNTHTQTHTEPILVQARHDVAGGMLFVASPFGMVLWKTMFNQKRHPELVSGSGEPYKLNTQTQTHTEPIPA